MSATLTRLTNTERRWAHAVFDAVFPGPERGALPLGIESMDLDGFLDQTLATVPFEAAIGLRLSLWVMALAPLFILRKLATIASLSPDERMRVLAAINASPVYALRSTVMMVKAIGALFYCGDRRVRPAIVAVAPPVVVLRPRKSALLPAVALTSGGVDHEHRRTA
jgi:hypothetical protein